MADDIKAIYPLDLLQEPVEDLLLVALPFLEDGYEAILLLVGDGDDPVVVGGAGARAVDNVEEELNYG